MRDWSGFTMWRDVHKEEWFWPLVVGLAYGGTILLLGIVAS